MAVIKTDNIDITIREVDFAERFERNWQHLRDILGIMRKVRRAPGTELRTKYAEVTLENGNVAEGDNIPFSSAEVKEKHYGTITLEKYAKGVTIESINEYGYDAAVSLTDDQFMVELQNKITGNFYAFLNTGMLKSTESTFQMALAMAQGYVRNKWKAMHRQMTGIVGFCNIIDAYTYLGAAQITTQNQFGMSYIENFLGYEKLFLLSDTEIARGKVIATPKENLILYYVDPADNEFKKAGLEFRTASGETNLIGVHMEGNYRNLVSESTVLMGMTLLCEYIDGVAVITFGGGDASNSADLYSLTVGNLALTPAFDPAVTSYTAATTNASNKVQANALYADAEVVVKLGQTVIANGTAVQWESGQNTVTVEVTNGAVTKSYTVTVTKT